MPCTFKQVNPASSHSAEKNVSSRRIIYVIIFVLASDYHCVVMCDMQLTEWGKY